MRRLLFAVLSTAFSLTIFVSFSLTLSPPLSAKPFQFENKTIAREASNYHKRLSKIKNSRRFDAVKWRQFASNAAGSDPRLAAQYYETAHYVRGFSAESWFDLANDLLSLKFSGRQRYQQSEVLLRASAAAYNAYRASNDPRYKALSLSLLGKILAKRSYYRPALNAYKASLSLVEEAATRQAYQKLQAEKGFRITNYNVNSDAANPRLCIQFSENLHLRGTDYANYFKVNNQDPAGLRVEKRQICVDGFKHGEKFNVLIKQGLPSTVDEGLLKSTNLTIYVRDRSPAVRFASKNYVLPTTGQRGIPLIGVNAKIANLSVFRVGDRNLSQALINGDLSRKLYNYDAERLENYFGAKVWSGDIELDHKLNKDVTTALPIETILPNRKPGIYVLYAYAKGAKNARDNASSQWFIVSDLGLTSIKAGNGIYSFVRSLSSAEPMKGVNVRMIARNNEVLGNSITDQQGLVRFDKALGAGKGGNQPVMLVAETSDGDYGFLDLTKSAFDLTDRGVAGRKAPGAFDSYIFAERGVYRPGEEVHLTALLRNQNASAVEGVPLTLIISRPDGVEQQRILLPDQGAGGRTMTIALIPTAMTGTWRVRAYVDPKGKAIGGTSFLVEDYVPERMTLAMKAAQDQWNLSGQRIVDLNGRYLYGAPAANHRISGQITLRQSTKPLKGFEGYHFGLHNERFSTLSRPLENMPNLRANGKLKLNIGLPQFTKPAKPLEARVTINLHEPGGRQITRAIVRPLITGAPMIGIKPLFKPADLGDQASVKFALTQLGSDGLAANGETLKWELLEVIRDYQWYAQNGRWNYEAVKYTKRVANGNLVTGQVADNKITAAIKSGRFRLEVTNESNPTLASSYEFNAGWHGGAETETPDFLDISSNQSTYQKGDQAELVIETRGASTTQPGKLLVAIINQGVLAMKEIDHQPATNASQPSTTSGNKTRLSFPVDEKWGSGAYAVALHYRPMVKDDKTASRHMPRRAIGVKWLKMAEEPRKLNIAFKLPKTVRSKQSLTIPVTITGLSPGEKSYLTLAAVDQGILNLTHYLPPKPDSYYYGQRRLSAEIRDLYGRLIDGTQGALGRIRSGGDGGGLAMQGAATTIKPLALYSGLVNVDENGKATVSFELDQFDGTLNVMAIAWSKDKIGSHAEPLTVRDPVVVTSSLPLFLTKGDKSQLHLSLDNVSGPEGSYKLTVKSNESVKFNKAPTASDWQQTVSLNKGQRLDMALKLDAMKIGTGKIAITLSHESGFQLERDYVIAVKPPAADASWRTVRTLPANGGKLTLTSDIFAGLLPKTASASLTIGSNAGLNVPGLYTQLQHYPYGCAEQTTSRAMPLLYVNELRLNSGQTRDNNIHLAIQKAVSRLYALQNSAGSFGLWQPSGGNIWLTSYVVDFLTRAKERKFDVPKEMLENALNRLQNTINYASDFSSGGENIAYALYVLARNGRANIGDLRYYADSKLGAFTTMLGKAQLASALAMYGDHERARHVFSKAISMQEPKEDRPYYRADFGSRLRDRAALLTLISESGISFNRDNLISNIGEARASQTYTSTQEQAWLLLAAKALVETEKSIQLSLNNQTHQGKLQRDLSLNALKKAPFEVTNQSGLPVTAIVTVRGAAEKAPPAASKGFQLSRKFYTLKGQEIDLKKVKQNERVIVVLTIEEDDNLGGRLLLEDFLPAGFQIENPRLVNSDNVKALSWLKLNRLPAHQSFRDDKFVASYNLKPLRSRKNSKRVPIRAAYIMRAMVPGQYIHPPVKLEDMYRPNRFARSSARTVTIEGLK